MTLRERKEKEKEIMLIPLLSGHSTADCHRPNLEWAGVEELAARSLVNYMTRGITAFVSTHTVNYVGIQRLVLYWLPLPSSSKPFSSTTSPSVSPSACLPAYWLPLPSSSKPFSSTTSPSVSPSACLPACLPA